MNGTPSAQPIDILRTGPHLGDDPGLFLIAGPLAMAGRVDGRHRETALGREAAGTGHDAGGLLVLPAAVSHQDQGANPGRAVRRPQHAGDLAEAGSEGEELFGDAVGRRLGSEAHCVSSLSGCLLRALPSDVKSITTDSACPPPG
jgi:hypothetical protein